MSKLKPNIYNRDDIKKLRVAGKITSGIRDYVISQIEAGMTTKDIDMLAKSKIQESGGHSVFYGYRGFPSHICISLNETVVHGFGDETVVKYGDLLSLDFGVKYDGFIGDTARTFCVGEYKEKAHQELLKATKESLYQGIKMAIKGNYVSDIGAAIENRINESGFSIVKGFVGHGVGRNLHEPPQVYNYDPGFKGELLKPGMVIAIEPMVNIGSEKVKLLKDGWTANTIDGKCSAHFEHTVLITHGEPEILTSTEIFK